MILTFLGASDSTRLSKTFVLNPPFPIEVHAYPNVRDFTSFQREPADLEEAFVMLQAHAAEGHCLIKGILDRPLVNEPRAGRTNAMVATDYLLLDLDFETGFESIDDFLAQIGLADTNYILHHSASAGVRYAPGLRAHILMPLATPQNPGILKLWLTNLNLRVEGLRSQLQLTASKMAVKFPLDITTCQNDKLIFIADPKVEGGEDPLADKRFELHLRGKPAATIHFGGVDPATIQTELNALVDDLRVETGLARKRAKMSKGQNPILLNPDQAVVTGVREGRGFVYLNLNGGDSWAYWYPASDPSILYNFKSEPPVRLQDIAPDYWEAVRPRDPIDIVEEGTTRFIARDNTSDTYYTCVYDPHRDFVHLNKAQRKHLPDFLAMTGEEMPEYVPEWRIEFDPTTNTTYRPDDRWVNTFRPTRYMKIDPKVVKPEIGTQINRILDSLCITPEMREYFLNWLAFTFQTRTKPKTAVVFVGVEGTGKGLLYAKILKKLFGDTHTIELKADILAETFNGWIDNRLIVCIDEFETSADDSRATTNLRNYITEETITIREMRRTAQEKKNYCAILLFTNKHDAMAVPVFDRRYTIAPRQENRLMMTDDDIDAIDGELEGFAAFLLTYQVNVNRVRTPLETESKNLMRLAAEPTGKRIIRAFREGDLQYLINSMEDERLNIDIKITNYNRMVREWVAHWQHPITITADQFRLIYDVLTNSNRGITKNFAMKTFASELHSKDMGRSIEVQFKEPSHPPSELVSASAKVASFPTTRFASNAHAAAPTNSPGPGDPARHNPPVVHSPSPSEG